MRLASALLVTTGLLSLTGCSIVGEEREYYMRQEWQQLKSTDWLGIGGDVTGFNEAFPSAQRKEQLAEQQICLHTNSGNRVTTQNGVSDNFTYRRCVLAPYDTQGGSRMGIRPDGKGTVIR